MRQSLILIPFMLAAAGCAASGYHGAAYLTAGTLGLKATTPTVESCAENVRMATKIPDPSSLGQLTQYGGNVPPDGVIGTCLGEGRLYFITPTEIQRGPAVLLEG